MPQDLTMTTPRTTIRQRFTRATSTTFIWLTSAISAALLTCIIALWTTSFIRAPGLRDVFLGRSGSVSGTLYCHAIPKEQGDTNYCLVSSNGRLALSRVDGFEKRNRNTDDDFFKSRHYLHIVALTPDLESNISSKGYLHYLCNTVRLCQRVRIGLHMTLWGITLPHSFAALLTSLPLFFTIPTLRRRRRQKKRLQKGQCIKCAYNLTGNQSGICPECGTPIPQPAT